MSCRILPMLALFLIASPGRAQALPVVEEGDWAAFRARCQALVDNLKEIGAPLPAGTVKALDALLAQKKPKDPEAAGRAVQKLLDPHCLVGVNINPESRVKAARGPLAARLALGRPAHVLVKVQNEAGVTHALSADSPQRHGAGKKGEDDRWLELAVRNDRPFQGRLSGGKVEYRVLTLTARQAGKREATISFDVGQGTQDLGFRAEVPVLFTVARRAGE